MIFLGEDDKEAAAYVSEIIKSASIKENLPLCYLRKRFPKLDQLARHPKTILAISALVESFVAIAGNVITRPGNNLSPTTTKLLPVVKIKVKKLRLWDVDSGMELGDADIDDDPDLRPNYSGDQPQQ